MAEKNNNGTIGASLTVAYAAKSASISFEDSKEREVYLLVSLPSKSNQNRHFALSTYEVDFEAAIKKYPDVKQKNGEAKLVHYEKMLPEVARDLAKMHVIHLFNKLRKSKGIERENARVELHSLESKAAEIIDSELERFISQSAAHKPGEAYPTHLKNHKA